MSEADILLKNTDKIHTTEMGLVRIKKNLELDVADVIQWCRRQIERPESNIYRQGKNWYIEIDNNVITVNAYSYTVITAHKRNKETLNNEPIYNA